MKVIVVQKTVQDMIFENNEVPQMFDVLRGVERVVNLRINFGMVCVIVSVMFLRFDLSVVENLKMIGMGSDPKFGPGYRCVW